MNAGWSVLDGFTITGGNANGSTGKDVRGAGIYCDSVSFTLSNCAIVDNNCTRGGGGMYCEDSSVDVTNCIFADNTSRDGAGVFSLRYGGSGESCLVFSNCVFSENIASNVSGGIVLISFFPMSAELTNCTFYGNQAFQAGGMASTLCNMPVTNCIFWGNTADVTDSNQIYTYYEDDDWKPSFSHCDIQDSNGSGEYWDSELGGDGGGNIDADPNFADPCDPNGVDNVWATDDDGLMLGPDSPCINAADFWKPVWTDVTGRIRTDISPYPDMGAYESSYKVILVMCFIDQAHDDSYYDDPDWPELPNIYDTDLGNFNDLLASLPTNDYSIIKAGCIVPPYYEPYSIADVLPDGFFDPCDPPQILWPEEVPVGLSIAECDPEPDGDELIAHFHRIREGKGPDGVINLASYTWSMYGLWGLGEGYRDEFKPWLNDWLEDHGLDPTGNDVFYKNEFSDERWIKAITEEVNYFLAQ